MLICTTTEKSCFWPDRERLINDVIIKKISSSSFSNNNQTWIVTDAAEWMWRWPASAQQSCLLWGSKVRALGSPSPSCTSTVLSLPSKPERSILGPSRFQSDQYRYLEDRETGVIYKWPCSKRAVISSTDIFVAIAKNTLYGFFYAEDIGKISMK